MIRSRFWFGMVVAISAVLILGVGMQMGTPGGW
jgi:hypothetical protein